MRIDLSFIKKKNKLYEIVNTEERLIFHTENMKQAELIGFDTETDGLNICKLPWSDKRKNRLVGICISYADNQGIYIPIYHEGIKNIEISLLQKYLFKLLETLPLATHNGIFDYKVMYDVGVKLNIVHDSMLLLFNICSSVGKATKKLKLVTRTVFGDETIEFEDIFETTKDHGKFRYVDEDVCRIYGCSDADYTRMLVYVLLPFLSQKQLSCYMNDVSLIALIATAEYQGKPIDMELLPEHKRLCEKNIEVLKDLLFNYVGWKMSGDKDSRYLFKATSSDELLNVFYHKLKYEPIKSYNETGKLKFDKFVLAKLKDRKTSVPDYFIENYVKQSIPDLLDEDTPLIKYDDLINAECPIAHIISALNKQVKNLTTFFGKIYKEADGESATYFSPISMTNTETARLVDFIQTLDGNLKYLIMAIFGTYMYVFDFCQIEYRVMAALACLRGLVLNLDHPHTDFHVELAAIIMNIKPEQVSSKMRKKFKPINFGIPYGMAVKGLVSSMYGVGLSPEKQKEAEEEVGKMLDQWLNALPEIKAMLNNYRDMAVIPRDYKHDVMKNIQNPSYVQGPDGRLRVFDLKDGGTQAIGKIRRQAGNYPIQSFARTIYLRAIQNFYNRLIKEELMDILREDLDSPYGVSFYSKVSINTFVHDEIGGFAENGVNPYYLYKIILEECMLKLPGHPTYYCGINICNNWKDGKDGEFEAPIDFVKAMQSNEKYVHNDDWVSKVGTDMTEFCNKDSVKYLEEIGGTKLTVDNTIVVTELLENWKDYFYKTQLKKFGYKYRANEVLDDQDADNAINYAVGTLLSSGYSGIKVVYEHKTDNVNYFLERSEVFKKELSFQEQVFKNIDIDEDIDEQLDFNMENGLEMDSEFEEVDIEANLNQLLSLLV